MTSAEARFNKSLRPRKPEGSLGRTAQDVHLDSHTAPELWCVRACLYSECVYAVPNQTIQGPGPAIVSAINDNSARQEENTLKS